MWSSNRKRSVSERCQRLPRIAADRQIDTLLKLQSAGVTWLNLYEKVTSLAAAFWTICNLEIAVFGSPYSRLLQ